MYACGNDHGLVLNVGVSLDSEMHSTDSHYINPSCAQVFTRRVTCTSNGTYNVGDATTHSCPQSTLWPPAVSISTEVWRQSSNSTWWFHPAAVQRADWRAAGSHTPRTCWNDTIIWQHWLPHCHAVRGEWNKVSLAFNEFLPVWF